MSRLGKISFIFAFVMVLCFAIAKTLIQSWIPFFWVLIGLFVLFVCVGAYVDRKFFSDFFSLKTTKHGMNMGALIFGFITLLVVTNIMGVRYYKVWDFSLNQVNSLSEQSIQLVKGLKQDLKVVYLYKQNAKNYEANRRMATELIRKYQDHSGRVKLEFYEADTRRDMAELYEFKGEQAVYLDYNGKKNRIDKFDEQEFTSALVKLTREKTKTLYFTTGHGEPDLESMDLAEALGHLKQLLENNNYTVKPLNLAGSAKMPTDLDVLFIVNPQFPFQKMEIMALEDFLKRGGSLFVALAYPDRSGLGSFLEKVGVSPGDGFVMNVLNSPLGPIVDPNGPTKGSKFSSTHSITRVFSKNDGVLFSKPVYLKRTPKMPEGITVDALVTTTESIQYKDSNLKQQGNLGDYILAMAVQGIFPGGLDKEKPFNMVVVGDSHFLENQMLYAFVNRDLVLNSVALLAKEENLISITPKEPMSTKIELTSAKEAALFWGFFLPMPIIFLISSLFFWTRRRHA